MSNLQVMILMNQFFLINQIKRPTELKLKNFSDLNQTSESFKGFEFTDDSLTESRVILLLALIQTYEQITITVMCISV